MGIKSTVRKLAGMPLRWFGCDILGPRELAEFRTLRQSSDAAPDLLTLLAPLLRGGTILQVGANNGDDQLGDLISEFNLAAVLVEPQPECFKQLQARYSKNSNVQLANVAIGTDSGTVTLYQFAPDNINGEDLTVFTSFNRHALEEARQKRNWDVAIAPLIMPAKTVSQILDEFQVRDLIAVIIDTEGFDYEVLKLVELDHRRPLLVQIEHHQMSYTTQNAAIQYFVANGYSVVRNKYDMFGLLPEIVNHIPCNTFPAGTTNA